MLQQVHEHIVGELDRGSRTDTIFVVTAIVFNLIVLAINSGVAASAASGDIGGLSTAPDLILIVFVLMTLLVNLIATVALNVGARTRGRLLEGLVAMYRDNAVDKYYHPSMLTDSGIRYRLFTAVILLLASTAIAVPLIIRFV